MESSTETAVLFSALQLADDFANGKLKCIEMIDLVVQNECNDTSESTQRIVTIISDAINEIVNGVESDFTKFEQDYWKFQVTYMLLMLALRDLMEENGEQQMEILESFPNVSLDLVLKLVAACDLEIAFIDILQNFNDHINMFILSHIVSKLHSLIEVGVPKVTVSDEFGGILNSIIGYVFIHSNGPVVKCLNIDNSNSDIIEKTSTVIENIIDLISVMFIDLFSAVATTEEIHGKSYPYIVAVFVGFVNYAVLLEYQTFFHLDILQIYMKEGDMYYWPDYSSDTPHVNHMKMLQEIIQKYSFKFLHDKELIHDILEMQTQKSIMSASVINRLKNNNDRILTKIFRCLENFDSEHSVAEFLVKYLSYSKDVKNVNKAHKTKWGYSCSSRLLLIEVQKLIHSNVQVKEDDFKKTKITRHKMTEKVLEYPVLKRVLQRPSLTMKQLKEKNIFIVGERIEGFECSFDWLLDSIWSDMSVLDADWFKCMNGNIDLMNCKHMQSLMNFSLKITSSTSQEVKNIHCIKELFLSVFNTLAVHNQNDIIEWTFLKVGNPRNYFEIDPSKTKLQVTRLLNRLTGSISGVPHSIVKEFSVQALQDPITVLDEMVKSVLKNQQHSNLVVEVLVNIPAVSQFRLASDENSTYFCECLNKALQDVDQDFGKEGENLIKFVTLLCKPKIGDSKAVQLLHRQEFLLRYIMPALPFLTKEQIDGNRNHMKILVIVIESLHCDDISWEAINQINPIILLDCLCHYLDEIDHILINPTNIGIFARRKSLIVKAVHALEELLLSHIKDLSSCEMAWLYCRLNRLSWYTRSYLLSLFWEYASSDDRVNFPMYIPKCLSKFLALETTSQDFRWIAANYSLSTNECLLKLCSVSNPICEKVLSMLKEKCMLFDDIGWVTALIKLLPVSLSEEWNRIYAILVYLKKTDLAAQNFKKSNSLKLQPGRENTDCFDKSEILAQNDILFLFMDTICILYEMDVIGCTSEGVLIKAFTTLCSQKGIPSIQRTLALYKEEIDTSLLEVITCSIFKLCMLFNKISVPFHDQVIGLLLEVINCYNDALKWNICNLETSSSANECNVFGFLHIEDALLSLPGDVRKVILKKLKSM